jgi:hypothetical protein
LAGQGLPGLDAIRQIGLTEQTFYRWKIGASLRHRFEHDAERPVEWARIN